MLSRATLTQFLRPSVADGLLHHVAELSLDHLLQRFLLAVELALALADDAVALAEALQLARLRFRVAVVDGVEAVVELLFLLVQRALLRLQRVDRRPHRGGLAQERLVADQVLASADARPEVRLPPPA